MTCVMNQLTNFLFFSLTEWEKKRNAKRDSGGIAFYIKTV